MDKIKAEFLKYSLLLTQHDVTFKQLNDYTPLEFKCKCNYTGMVCSKTNHPHGFGRLIATDNSVFIDGQFN